MLSISDYDIFKVVRPILGQEEQYLDQMPIIKNMGLDKIDYEQLKATNYQNIKQGDKNTLLLGFCYDKILFNFWSNPLKYLLQVKQCGIVATPDFSVYPNMNKFEVAHNVYMNRWLGVLWQNVGCNVIPTISWCDGSTYDVCFSGVEKGSVVVISTIGCKNNKEIFLAGFKEMKKRINPQLIIVYGDMIPGMTGRFLNFKYEETLMSSKKSSKSSCFKEIFIVKGDGENG